MTERELRPDLTPTEIEAARVAFVQTHKEIAMSQAVRVRAWLRWLKDWNPVVLLLGLLLLSSCAPLHVVEEVTECKFASCRVLLKSGDSLIVPEAFGEPQWVELPEQERIHA